MTAAKKARPTLRARWLGQQLRELRETAGFTLRQSAEYIQRDPSMLSRFEAAEYPIRRPEVLALLDFYGVCDQRRRGGLLVLAEEIWRKGWWDRFPDVVHDTSVVDLVWLESCARTIHSFANEMFADLVQTPAYAAATIAAVDPDATLEQVERRVELRMARQHAVYTARLPPHVVTVVDQSLLRRMVGDTGVMREQLTTLIDLGRRPNVEVRILPLSLGPHPASNGAFELFTMPSPYPELAHIATLAGGIYVEAPGVERFAAAYDRLLRVALSPEESAELIAAAAKELS